MSNRFGPVRRQGLLQLIGGVGSCAILQFGVQFGQISDRDHEIRDVNENLRSSPTEGIDLGKNCDGTTRFVNSMLDCENSHVLFESVKQWLH